VSDPINLSRARKSKARAAKAREAAANRTREGQTKAERALRTKQDTERARHLEGVRLDPPDER
jgi:hypothetical protein